MEVEKTKQDSLIQMIKKNKRHPKCLGDGFEDCGYNTMISCDECKYNNSPLGKKDPNAKCNQAQRAKN